jgi:hypothetical protein
MPATTCFLHCLPNSRNPMLRRGDWTREEYDKTYPIWQEAEVRRLVAEHGAEMFAGLDLFGIV